MSKKDRSSAAARPKRRFRLPVRKRTFLVFGSLLAIGALITSASFTDAEWARADVATGTYNLRISEVSNTGPWRDNTTALAPVEVDIVTPDGDNLIPDGAPAVTDLWIQNVGDYGSTLGVTITATGSSVLSGALDLEVNGNPVELNTRFRLPNDLDVLEVRPITITVTLPQAAASQDGIQGQDVTLLAKFDGTSIAP